MVLVAVCLAAIVGAGAWLTRPLWHRRGPVKATEHLWECGKCQHRFRAPLTAVAMADRPLNLAEILGRPTTCPKCGGEARCRPLVRCRTCGAAYVATVAAAKSGGRVIPLRCIHRGCQRPLLSGRPLPAGDEEKGQPATCGRCGRTFVVVEWGKATEETLTCPYSDHGASSVRLVR